MPKFLQPTLSGGELSPGLQGRVDMVRYAISLKRARNFITKPTGGGVKRQGLQFRGRMKYSDKVTRMLPFVYSTEVRYLIEAGLNYFRFWVDGALLTNSNKPIEAITKANPAVVTSTAHGFTNGDQVVITGVRGMTKVNAKSYTVAGVTTNTFQLAGVDSTAYATYISGGTAGRIVEVATPFVEADLPLFRFTQSADVFYIASGSQRIKELRRLTASSFELVDYDFRRGPFRPFNTDEAKVMAVSGTTGVVTVTTNADVFAAEMVDSLIYVEEKELRGIKPWASGEKGVVIGILRRSDSKVYRCSAVPTLPGGGGTPYRLTGGSRPVHSTGRAWDGPGDTKFDNVQNYTTGVEWEFLHNTFGILKITEYLTTKTVKAVVIERVPDSIVGSIASPAGTWTFSGNASTKVFAITGATSDSPGDYTVTINGLPVQSNPSYQGGGGVNNPGGGNVRPGSGFNNNVVP